MVLYKYIEESDSTLKSDLKEIILSEYEKNKSLNEEFCTKIELLIKDILNENGIIYHSIDSRLKEESSLATKVENGESKYNSLSDITDVSGLRIITYFSDDVDKVAEVIMDEFSIDVANSVDKRLRLDPDRFGYLSLHYVVSLNEERIGLSEYKRFKNMKIEIQIRSILQHAWAEIEHDLGYKNKSAVPNVVRRDFSRLAGILELADEEFNRIRIHLEEYNKQIQLKMETSSENILIDKITLKNLLANKESIINEIDVAICNYLEGSLKEEIEDSYLNLHVERLKFLGFNTLNEILHSLKIHKNELINFAQIWLTESGQGRGEVNVPQGISLFYLAYIIVANKEDEKYIKEYLDKNHFEMEEQEKVIKRIANTYKEVQTKLT